ncbi:MAG: polyphosphate kinase 2 [Alphaproteobacteria bacterium]
MTDAPPPIPKLPRKAYEQALLELQLELVKLQAHMRGQGLRIVVVVEGRDAAGKDGTIKRIVMHLSPRSVRAVALPKPSDRDRASWYFQRYVSHLPAEGEMILFNRSWYNRAGVEPVMGFCTPAEHAAFLASAPEFEAMLRQGDIVLVKYWLDISWGEQKKRLGDRRADPLKSWKVSALDDVAIERFDEYTAARDEMLKKTSVPHAQWTIARADRKRTARIEIIRDLLSRFDFPNKNSGLAMPNRNVVFPFDPSLLDAGWLAR